MYRIEMKNLTFFIVILFFSKLAAQKVYDFDYLLEYDKKISLFKSEKDSVNSYLINSKDNSFLLMYGFSNDSCIFHLTDRNGFFVRGKYLKMNFENFKIKTYDCKNVSKFRNIYKDKVKEYYFENYKDTIIDGKEYYHYAIKSNKELKYQTKRKIVSYHYIVEKESPNFLPFLFHSTPYNEWNKERNIPNGIPFIIYYQDVNGKIIFQMNLVKEQKVKKLFVIPKECIENK